MSKFPECTRIRETTVWVPSKKNYRSRLCNKVNVIYTARTLYEHFDQQTVLVVQLLHEDAQYNTCTYCISNFVSYYQYNCKL